jgi:hypothetical protein
MMMRESIALHPASLSCVMSEEPILSHRHESAPGDHSVAGLYGSGLNQRQEDDMWRFQQFGLATVAGLPHRFDLALALASLLVMAPAAQASGEERRDQSAELAAVTRELESVKAELQGMKARVSELEGDIAQTRDALDTFREEAVAAPAKPAALTFPVQKDRASMPDVDVTGAINKAPPLSAAEEKQFTKADELLGRGDIAGARLVLEQTSGANAAAAFRLGETYDPKRLAAWRVVGMRGDAVKARELYQRAYAGGITEARERLAGLP